MSTIKDQCDKLPASGHLLCSCVYCSRHVWIQFMNRNAQFANKPCPIPTNTTKTRHHLDRKEFAAASAIAAAPLRPLRVLGSKVQSLCAVRCVEKCYFCNQFAFYAFASLPFRCRLHSFILRFAVFCVNLISGNRRVYAVADMTGRTNRIFSLKIHCQCNSLQLDARKDFVQRYCGQHFPQSTKLDAPPPLPTAGGSRIRKIIVSSFFCNETYPNANKHIIIE